VKRLTVLLALALAVITAFALLAGCDDPSAPASPTPVEIDIDHGRHSKPRTKAPSAPRAKTPSFRKPSTTGRRR
jgi:nitrous oxide reductase accessory protein NosL